MSLVAVLLTLMLLAAVMAVISRPLLMARTAQGASTGAHSEARGQSGTPDETQAQAELEVAREAKYREIRDTELDYRTGKLSREDYEAVNGALRAEAVEILDLLERIEQEQAPDPTK